MIYDRFSLGNFPGVTRPKFRRFIRMTVAASRGSHRLTSRVNWGGAIQLTMSLTEQLQCFALQRQWGSDPKRGKNRSTASLSTRNVGLDCGRKPRTARSLDLSLPSPQMGAPARPGGGSTAGTGAGGSLISTSGNGTRRRRRAAEGAATGRAARALRRRRTACPSGAWRTRRRRWGPSTPRGPSCPSR